MQAIQTKYLPATNHKGGRISVRADAGRMIVSWAYELGPDDNHKRAAELFAQKMGWLRDGWRLESGALPDHSRVHVLVKS